MKLLIIGADSYLGARLFFDLSKKYEIVGTYFSLKLTDDFLYLDIADKSAVRQLIADVRPEVIVHVANVANIKWCRENPEKTRIINLEATKYIVDAANEIAAKLIYISSVVAVDPSSVYADLKVESENIVKTVKFGYFIVRPSTIFGYSPNTINDRPFNRLLRNLEGSVPAAYDNSSKLQPTYVGHIGEVIDIALQKGIWGQTLTVAVDDGKTRFEIARDILEPFGVKVEELNSSDPANKIPMDENIGRLKQFGFPEYDYQTIIKKIVDEIKNSDKFKL
jgi:dTDP-4-dehydrorhamnose reductase